MKVNCGINEHAWICRERSVWELRLAAGRARVLERSSAAAQAVT